jgi:restriction system protein
MPRYWVIAPFESKKPEIFERVWQYDLTHNLISIGWSGFGDVSSMSREQLADVINSHYPDKPSTTKSLYLNMIWSFYHEIALGDFVIARRGRKTLAGIGKVIDTATYAPGRNPVIDHANFLEVDWQDRPRNKNYSDIVFPMHTLMEIDASKYRSLVDGSDVASVSEPEPQQAVDQNAFALEKHLEDFIVANFANIFKGKMQIYEDDGEKAQQYSTDIGLIDILDFEPSSGAFVVIELKKGRPSDQVVGQVLRYMGWVQKNLCKDGLSYALQMTNNIDVRHYSVTFTLR